MKFETILAINGYELVSVNGSYQVYSGDVCLESWRGNFSRIKKHFKGCAKKSAFNLY